MPSLTIDARVFEREKWVVFADYIPLFLMLIAVILIDLPGRFRSLQDLAELALCSDDVFGDFASREKLKRPSKA